jgi:hypothetical protein
VDIIARRGVRHAIGVTILSGIVNEQRGEVLDPTAPTNACSVVLLAFLRLTLY